MVSLPRPVLLLGAVTDGRALIQERRSSGSRTTGHGL